jgi:hypothetical protein
MDEWTIGFHSSIHPFLRSSVYWLTVDV